VTGEAVAAFEQGDALLVVDVLDDFEHEDAEPLLASFKARGAGMERAIAQAREAGVPVIYVNDDRDRWDSDAPALAREASAGIGGDVIRRIVPRPGDRVRVMETRPLSKLKRWRIVEVLERAK